MAECHVEGKKVASGSIEVYAGGFKKNIYRANGLNGNVGMYQSTPKSNGSTYNSAHVYSKREVNSLHGATSHDERNGVANSGINDAYTRCSDGAKGRSDSGVDRLASKFGNQNGGLYIGAGKFGSSTNGFHPKVGTNGGASTLVSGTAHNLDDGDSKNTSIGNSFSSKVTTETSLQVGYASGNGAGPKSTKSVEGNSSGFGAISAPKGSPNAGGPVLGNFKVGNSGHGEAVSNCGSSNGGSPTAEMAKGMKSPSAGNMLGNGASPNCSNRGIGNIVGPGVVGKSASARVTSSESQSPSFTSRGSSTPRNSGEFNIAGNGNLRGSASSSPRSSGELSTSGTGTIRASTTPSAKVSADLTNNGSGSSRGSSATPRNSGEVNINGRIVTGTNAKKGSRSTAVSPIRSNSAAPNISNMGNLRKGNWTGNVLTGGESTSNGAAGKYTEKVDFANGNILNVGNLSHGQSAGNGNVLNSGISSNGFASKVTGKVDAPKNGVDTPSSGNAELASDSVLIKRALCSKDPEEVKTAGNELYKRGLFSEALSLYERAIALSPGHPSYRSNKAAALSGLGRLAEAVHECEEAIKLDPFYVRAHQRAASLYLRLGLVESSKRHYQASGQQSDLEKLLGVEEVKKHISKCIEMRKAANWKGVIRESDAAVMGGADSAPQVFGYKAEALLRLHRPEEADVILSTAQKVESSLTKLGVTPVDSFLFVVRAQIDMALGRFELAVIASESAARADSRSVEAFSLLKKARAVCHARNSGNELFKSGKFFEACAAYGEGLESDPVNAVLLCNRAACRSKLGQWEKAVEDCNAALDIQPSYTKALMRRANCNAKLERWEDALIDYEALLKEVPGDMDVARGLFDVQVAIKKSRGEEIYKMRFGGDVEVVSNNDQFREAVTFPGLVVVQFITRWNERCKQISPFMDGLCKRYPSVNFIKVDIEENPYLAKTESISFVPTFKIYKNGMKVKEILGPSQQALEYAVQHYSL